MKNNNDSTFLFEEPTIIAGKLLAMMEAAALHHIPKGRVSQLHGVPPHFLHNICAFLDREFRRGAIPWPPLSPDLTPLQFCFLRSVKDTVYQKEMNKLCERIVETAGYITNKMFANHGKKMHIELMCDVPLMVSILRSNENTRNFVIYSI
jgi:hypothetical protein